MGIARNWDTHSSAAPRDDPSNEDGGVSSQGESKAVLSSHQVDSPGWIPLVLGGEHGEGALGGGRNTESTFSTPWNCAAL